MQVVYLKGSFRYVGGPTVGGGSGTGAAEGVPNMSREQCNGTWTPYNTVNYTLNPLGTCYPNAPKASAPAAQQAPANITVSVPTNVNTQVSPQISPNLIQQQQPTNSPVGAATSSTPQQTIPNNTTDAAYERFMEQLALRDQAIADLMGQQQPQQGPTSSGIITVPMSSPDEGDDTGSSVTIAPTNSQTYMKYGLIAALAIAAAIAYSSRNKSGKGKK